MQGHGRVSSGAAGRAAKMRRGRTTFGVQGRVSGGGRLLTWRERSHRELAEGAEVVDGEGVEAVMLTKCDLKCLELLLEPFMEVSV